MARSLNKAILIGNLTNDPELRMTPSGAQVATFSIATNRDWTTDKGEKKQESQFHKCVAWNKLAELCTSSLHKGSRVYIEGRISTRSYEKDGDKRHVTEVVLDDVIFLDKKEGGEE